MALFDGEQATREPKGYTPAKTIVQGHDDLTSRRQRPVRLVDPEGHDRVRVLLIAVTLVGVRIEDFGRGIEAKKAGGLRVGRRPVHRR